MLGISHLSFIQLSARISLLISRAPPDFRKCICLFEVLCAFCKFILNYHWRIAERTNRGDNWNGDAVFVNGDDPGVWAQNVGSWGAGAALESALAIPALWVPSSEWVQCPGAAPPQRLLQEGALRPLRVVITAIKMCPHRNPSDSCASSPDMWEESQFLLYGCLGFPLFLAPPRCLQSELPLQHSGMRLQLACVKICPAPTVGWIIDSNGCKIHSSGAVVFIFFSSQAIPLEKSLIIAWALHTVINKGRMLKSHFRNK